MTTGRPDGAAGAGATADVDAASRFSAADVVDAAWDALRGVYDPELCLDVVSLGLVYDVGAEGDSLVVDMTMTTPGCPASEVLPEMARAAIARAVDNAFAVEVRVVWDPPWSPAMIEEDAARSCGFRAR